MLVLLDRAFDANAFLADLAGTGAALLARSKSTRNPPVLTHLPDGSYLSCLDGLPVRIIEADLAMTGADGSRVHDRYRLITTLTDRRGRNIATTAVVRRLLALVFYCLRDGHIRTLQHGDARRRSSTPAA